MGTVFSFDVRGFTNLPRVRAALEEAVAFLHRTDAVFSTYRYDSQISRLARGELDLRSCDAEVREVLRLCEEAERRSDGWFSARYRGRSGTGPDPTGLVKGWAVERAARTLAEAGAEAVCVNGGGDVQTMGGPWRIGISDPLTPGAIAAVVEVGADAHETAVATSGPAERGCHILDPHTGQPSATRLASITVLCSTLTAADAWATAAYAMGDAARTWLSALPGAQAFAVTIGGGTWHTTGFPGPAVPAGPGKPVRVLRGDAQQQVG
ncbi:FAD:protein FMN transferase [Streptomyces sp. NPDC006207]